MQGIVNGAIGGDGGGGAVRSQGSQRSPEDGFQGCAWMYSGQSLSDLYTMPYMESSVGAKNPYGGGS